MKLPLWFFSVYAPCVSWVLHFAADTGDDVLHHPARREHNLVPGDRPSPLPPRFLQTGFPSTVWEMDESLSNYWQDVEQVLRLDWVALASSLIRRSQARLAR